jgi:hypothetical protein
MHIVIALILTLSSPAHPNHGHHYGWQQPRNPHHVTVTWPRTVPTCTWVQTNSVGSTPVCVPIS